MADALLSEDHFYVNASYYNDTEVDQKARIVVKDTTNILDRSDDWLVHVTRFSVDSMKSLSYIEADLNKFWEIRLHNAQGTATNTYNFVLDNDYATPQALIEAMNMGGATLAVTRLVYEAYRFQLDAGGRFRLTGPLAENEYCTYVGSPAMNTLLGFDNASPTIRFTPSASKQFAGMVDWLHEQAIELGTVANVFSGQFHSAFNNVLVHLLNGVKTHCSSATNSQAVVGVSTQAAPFVTDQASLDAYNVMSRWPEDKGVTPTVQGRDNEALLPQSNREVLLEYWDRPQGGVHSQEDGFRARVLNMRWAEPYTVATDLGDDEHPAGELTFFQAPSSNETQQIPPASFPTYHPGRPGVYAVNQYFYPYDSLPGYNWHGWGNPGTADAVAVSFDTPWALDQFFFEQPLPSGILPGHDMWVQDPQAFQTQAALHALSNNQKRPYIVRQVMSIAEDRMSVRCDYGVSPTMHSVATDALQHDPIGFSVMFTNRRVPFQSRARCHVNCLRHGESTDGGAFGVSTVVLDHGFCLPLMPGDTFFWVVDGVLLDGQNFTVDDGSRTSFSYHGPLPNLIAAATYINGVRTFSYNADRTGLFVWNRAADLLRWNVDALQTKMASTTFSYQVGTADGGEHPPTRTLARYPINPYPRLEADSWVYPHRYHQGYDKVRLTKQVARARLQLFREFLFAGSASTDGTGSIAETLTHDQLSSIPDGIAMVETPSGPLLTTGNHDVLKTAERGLVWPYGRGSQFSDITNPFYGIATYTDQPTAMTFVTENLDDKPWIMLANSNTQISDLNAGLALLGGTQNSVDGNVASGAKQVAPLICGIAPRLGKTTTDFVIYAPQTPISTVQNMTSRYQPINIQYLLLRIVVAQDTVAHLAVAFDSASRGYNMARKELQGTQITTAAPARLYGSDGDYIASTVASHVDLIFPFNQLILTSDDLQQVPEKTQDAGSRQPILSGYTLSTFVPTAVDKHGEPAGSTSTPFGTIYFSEGGQRRYHHLMRLSGPLRQFSINCAITYKDPTVDAREMVLHPGGQFTAQLLFIKKMEER